MITKKFNWNDDITEEFVDNTRFSLIEICKQQVVTPGSVLEIIDWLESLTKSKDLN